MVLTMSKQQLSGGDSEAYKLMQMILARGDASLSDVLEMIERIQTQLRSISDAIKTVRQQKDGQAFGPTTPLQSLDFPAVSIEELENVNVNARFNEQFFSNAVIANVTSSVVNPLLLAKSNTPQAAAMREKLQQEQAGRILIFKLREEKKWHNANQPVRVAGRWLELTFDVPPGGLCEESACYNKFGVNNPGIKVWPKYPPIIEAEEREKLECKRICLKHATKWFDWVLVKEADLSNYELYGQAKK